MTKNCERPPTNAEIFYKIFHEFLDFCWKFIKLILNSIDSLCDRSFVRSNVFFSENEFKRLVQRS